MNALLERLSPEQLVILILVLIGGIVTVIAILATTKYQLQSLADETMLKREKQQAELSLRTKMIEHAKATGSSLDALLALDETPPDINGLNAELAKRFGKLETSTDDIQQTLERAMAQESSRKQAIIDVIDDLFNSGADHGPILATVRGLCSSEVTKEKGMPVSTPV